MCDRSLKADFGQGEGGGAGLPPAPSGVVGTWQMLECCFFFYTASLTEVNMIAGSETDSN